MFIKTNANEQGVGVPTNGGEVEQKPRRKTPTLGERLSNIFVALQTITGIDQADWDRAVDLAGYSKAQTDNSKPRGLFFTVFNRQAGENGTWILTDKPTVGLQINPLEVLEITDGKGAFTEALLKRWANKGVPFGRGAKAKVSFHKRCPEHEAFYRLDFFEPSVPNDPAIG